MTKLIDTDKLLSNVHGLKDIWQHNYSVSFVLDSIAGEVEAGMFDAADELQPVVPRQTLLEALEGAPVGTRYRFKKSSSLDWIIVVSPGKVYSDSIFLRDDFANGPKAPHSHYEHSGLVRYADEFIIEFPTY